MKYLSLYILLFTGYVSYAQLAGYRNIISIDSSRRYKPGASADDRLYYRPVEIGKQPTDYQE